MIKAGTLFYAIVISLIFSIVTSSLILFSYLSRIEFDEMASFRSMRLDVSSGLNLHLSDENNYYSAPATIDLFDDGEHSVVLTKKSWGALEVISSTSTKGDRVLSAVAAVGYAPDSSSQFSLFLADHDRPLALAGSTLIKGRAFLPKAGVKRAYIEGQSFNAAHLVSGEVKKSAPDVPPLNKQLSESLISLLKMNDNHPNDSVVIVDVLPAGEKLDNSFLQKTIVFSSDKTLMLSEVLYNGNFIIRSSSKIVVGADCSLIDVILLAPKIVVKEGFRGNLQMFASDSLIIEKDVNLAYPSVLGVLKGNTKNVSAVILNEKDSISGMVFAFHPTDARQYPVGVFLKKDSFVQGHVYSNGFADASGTIFGSLTCNTIILQTPSSVYENHLLNSVIDITSLSKSFVGTGLFAAGPDKKIIKHLK
jgi:hypothetical protein